MPEWPTLSRTADVIDLTEQLGASENDREILQEAIADLELAAEDRGWRKLGVDAEREFTRSGLQQNAQNARVMVVASPLIKRGIMLRTAYVWGQGVTVQARAGHDADQDVNAVVSAWWDDQSNQAALTSSQAQEELERTGLGADGNVFLAFFTAPRTGRVQVRSTPFDEIQDVITNPDDRDEPWYYLREYETSLVVPTAGGGSTRTQWARIRVLHPALDYRPRMRPRAINGIPIMWDAPMLHVSVNRLDGWKFGIGDAYAALPWARAYDGFLTDWAKLVKALSRFAWKVTGDRPGRASKAATAIRAAQPPEGMPGQVGGTAAYGPGASLEAIPKTGATIDSESGRPLAAMVAAALGVPVTMLLADPGVTGARATAETLDKPTILEAGMRRSLWGDVFRRATSYVIDQAVKAPSGPLRGTVARDEWDREVITLAGDVERTVDVDWPDLNELDPGSLIEALSKAEAFGTPKAVLVRLALQALKVKDVDELMENLVDADGNFLDPDVSAAVAAVEKHRRGEDPADQL